jgi:hypothetical protein
MNESTVLIDSPQETLPYKISPMLSGKPLMGRRDPKAQQHMLKRDK